LRREEDEVLRELFSDRGREGADLIELKLGEFNSAIVDYAHYPLDALENCTEDFLMECGGHRAIDHVVGCGGNSDKDQAADLWRNRGQEVIKFILTSQPRFLRRQENIPEGYARQVIVPTEIRKMLSSLIEERPLKTPVLLSKKGFILIAGKGP